LYTYTVATLINNTNTALFPLCSLNIHKFVKQTNFYNKSLFF